MSASTTTTTTAATHTTTTTATTATITSTRPTSASSTTPSHASGTNTVLVDGEREVVRDIRVGGVTEPELLTVNTLAQAVKAAIDHHALWNNPVPEAKVASLLGLAACPRCCTADKIFRFGKSPDHGGDGTTPFLYNVMDDIALPAVLFHFTQRMGLVEHMRAFRRVLSRAKAATNRHIYSQLATEDEISFWRLKEDPPVQALRSRMVVATQSGDKCKHQGLDALVEENNKRIDRRTPDQATTANVNKAVVMQEIASSLFGKGTGQYVRNVYESHGGVPRTGTLNRVMGQAPPTRRQRTFLDTNIDVCLAQLALRKVDFVAPRADRTTLQNMDGVALPEDAERLFTAGAPLLEDYLRMVRHGWNIWGMNMTVANVQLTTPGDGKHSTTSNTTEAPRSFTEVNSVIRNADTTGLRLCEGTPIVGRFVALQTPLLDDEPWWLAEVLEIGHDDGVPAIRVRWWQREGKQYQKHSEEQEWQRMTTIILHSFTLTTTSCLKSGTLSKLKRLQRVAPAATCDT